MFKRATVSIGISPQHIESRVKLRMRELRGEWGQSAKTAEAVVAQGTQLEVAAFWGEAPGMAYRIRMEGSSIIVGRKRVPLFGKLRIGMFEISSPFWRR